MSHGSNNTEPTWEFVGDNQPLTDAAIAAIARLLLGADLDDCFHDLLSGFGNNVPGGTGLLLNLVTNEQQHRRDGLGSITFRRRS